LFESSRPLKVDPDFIGRVSNPRKVARRDEENDHIEQADKVISLGGRYEVICVGTGEEQISLKGVKLLQFFILGRDEL